MMEPHHRSDGKPLPPPSPCGWSGPGPCPVCTAHITRPARPALAIHMVAASLRRIAHEGSDALVYELGSLAATLEAANTDGEDIEGPLTAVRFAQNVLYDMSDDENERIIACEQALAMLRKYFGDPPP